MRALNEFVRAGVTLVSAGAFLAAPLTPVPESPPEPRVVSSEVTLTASSIANIPVNLFYAIANIPANLVQGLNSWADALEAGGSWWLKTPTNVWGWDPANPPMIQAAINVLVPFPVISGNGGLPDGITPNGKGRQEAGPSEPITAENSILGGKAQPGTLGYLFNVLAAAQLPMHPSCGFECYDVLGALGGYFQVPPSELRAGYTFPQEIVNPNDTTGQYPPAWQGQTAEPLDFAEPFVNFVKSLMEDPPTTDAIKPVSLSDIVNVIRRLNDSATIAFNPWFSGSFLLTGFPLYAADILIGGLVKGVIQRLCPVCGIAPDQPPATPEPPSEDTAATPTSGVPESTPDATRTSDTRSVRRQFDARTGAVAKSPGSAVRKTGTKAVAQDPITEEETEDSSTSAARDEATSEQTGGKTVGRVRTHDRVLAEPAGTEGVTTESASRKAGADAGRTSYTHRSAEGTGDSDDTGSGHAGVRHHKDASDTGGAAHDDGE